MENLLVADYSLDMPLPPGAHCFRPDAASVPFSIKNIILLALGISPDKPPFLNFSDTNTVFRFAGCHSEKFVDRWQAEAIAEESKKRLLWENYDQIFCPGTVVFLDGASKWIMPVLKRKEGESVFSVEFIGNGRMIQDRQRSALAFIPSVGMTDATAA